jgi:hypothetical protein
MRVYPNAMALVSAITVILMLGAGAAQALEVVQDPSGNVVKIVGLEMNGGTPSTTGVFDVDFVYGRGIDLIGDALELSFNDRGDALFAVSEVADVLADESTPVTSAGPATDTSIYYDIPYELNGDNARIVRGIADGAGQWNPGNLGEYVDYVLEDRSYAKFTRTDTQVEATSWGRLKTIYR